MNKKTFLWWFLGAASPLGAILTFLALRQNGGRFWTVACEFFLLLTFHFYLRIALYCGFLLFPVTAFPVPKKRVEKARPSSGVWDKITAPISRFFAAILRRSSPEYDLANHTWEEIYGALRRETACHITAACLSALTMLLPLFGAPFLFLLFGVFSAVAEWGTARELNRETRRLAGTVLQK